MSRGKAIALGVFTAWPPLYLLIFMAMMFWMVFSARAHSEDAAGLGTATMVLFALHLGTMLLGFVLLAIYIVNVFKNDLVVEERKTLWVVVLFFGNMFAMPVYWYLFIWKPIRSP